MEITDKGVTKNVFTSGDVPKPTYAEAFWLKNTNAVVLECGSRSVLQYDFDHENF
jgi:hypothetical protein